MVPPTNIIQETARRLQEYYVTQGTRVAIWADNCAEVACLITACWSAGAVVVPLSKRLTDVQVEAVLRDMDCHCLVADHDRGGQGAIDLAIVVPKLNGVFSGLSWTDLDLDLAACASIVTTSGSTGKPKGVVHTLANHYYSALGSHENIPFGANNVWLVSLPLYHVGGLALIMRSLLFGGTLAFPKPGEELHVAIERVGATHLSLVPTQLTRLTKIIGGGRLQAILIGGAPCPVSLVKEAAEQGLPVHLTYGSTEMASQVTTTAAGEAALVPDCSGKVLPYRELKLASDGEILVRGDTRFAGYVTAEVQEEPFDSDGWFATGDLGRFDDQGRLFVLGRKDTMFISGGENIYPEEIEKALMDHLDAEACVVVPIADEHYGQRPVAFVKTTSPLPARDDLALNLERFKWPDRLIPWPKDIPVSLKPDRRCFRQVAGHLD